MTQAQEHSGGDHGHGHGHGSRFIQHHYDDAQHQFDAGKLGIWFFLAQEVLFFSALFVAYILYRHHHPEIFAYAHHYLDVKWGAINTAVLIISSLSAAWAVRCAQLGQKKGLILCIGITIACACGFLGIKFIEYKHKYHERILFGTKFDPCVSSGGTHLITRRNECPGTKSTVEWDFGGHKAKQGCFADTIDTDPRTPGYQADCLVSEVKFKFTWRTEKVTKWTAPKAAPKGAAEADLLAAGWSKKPSVDPSKPPTWVKPTGDPPQGIEPDALKRAGWSSKLVDNRVRDKTEAGRRDLPACEYPEEHAAGEHGGGHGGGHHPKNAPCWIPQANHLVCPTGAAVLVLYGDEAERGEEFEIDATCNDRAASAPVGDPFAPPPATGPSLGEKLVQPHHAPTKHELNEQLASGPPPANTNMFFSIYFAMTGLHGIHVLVGVFVFVWLLIRAIKGHFTPDYFGPIDYAALYWHLVDLIWIFLFPMLYLIH